MCPALSEQNSLQHLAKVVQREALSAIFWNPGPCFPFFLHTWSLLCLALDQLLSLSVLVFRSPLSGALSAPARFRGVILQDHVER